MFSYIFKTCCHCFKHGTVHVKFRSSIGRNNAIYFHGVAATYSMPEFGALFSKLNLVFLCFQFLPEKGKYSIANKILTKALLFLSFLDLNLRIFSPSVTSCPALSVKVIVWLIYMVVQADLRIQMLLQKQKRLRPLLFLTFTKFPMLYVSFVL